MCGKGYKIIDIQETPPSQIFTDSKSGNGNHTIYFLHIGEPIACTFLTQDAGEKLLFRDVRAKLPYYGITSSDLSFGSGDSNAHGCFVMAPN